MKMRKKTCIFIFISIVISIIEAGKVATDSPASWSSRLGVFNTAAVSSDGVQCSRIGKNILKKGGTAIDASIASLFCLGVVSAQSCGIGGGFFLTYYQKSTGKVFTLDAREVAPENSYSRMYENDTTKAQYGSLAVAIPGETKGYFEAYQRLGGGVPWADLIEPTIKLCRDGFPVSYHMAFELRKKEEYIKKEPTMSIFVNPVTGKVLQEGETMLRKDLIPTLRTLQEEPEALYTGSLSEKFQSDLAALGSIITKEDLANYKVIWRKPIFVNLPEGDKLFSFPPPGSGVIYGFMMNILSNFNFTPDNLDDSEIATTYQRIVETFKYGYAERSKLGDPDFTDLVFELVANLTSKDYISDISNKITDNMTYQYPLHYGAKFSTKNTHGTTHLSILAPNGDAVAATSTINYYFGAAVRSEETGILLNNEMDDFHTSFLPNSNGLYPSPVNFIEPGKRPLSSMCPSIIVDKEGNVKLVIGAAGGSYITTAVTWASVHNLWLGKNIKEAIDSPRLHHPLIPMVLRYEDRFNKNILRQLEAIGHNTSDYSEETSMVNAISSDGSKKYANADYRKRGGVAGF